jgi:tripartite-type tricarboxylate transporter receptor subunit TctC
MLNALAVIGDRRSNQLPEIKTTAEYDLPRDSRVLWDVRSEGTPRTIVNKIDAAAQAALRDSKVQQQLEKASYLAKALGPDQFRTILTDSSARWTKIIKDTDI